MPKVPIVERSCEECEGVIEKWMASQKLTSLKGVFEIVTDDNRLVNKEGEIYGDYVFGLRKEEVYEEQLWVVTHLKSKYSLGPGFMAKTAAVRFMKSIAYLVKLDFVDVDGFSKVSHPVKALFNLMAKRGVSSEDLNKVCKLIESKK